MSCPAIHHNNYTFTDKNESQYTAKLDFYYNTDFPLLYNQHVPKKHIESSDINDKKYDKFNKISNNYFPFIITNNENLNSHNNMLVNVKNKQNIWPISSNDKILVDSYSKQICITNDKNTVCTDYMFGNNSTYDKMDFNQARWKDIIHNPQGQADFNQLLTNYTCTSEKEFGFILGSPQIYHCK